MVMSKFKIGDKVKILNKTKDVWAPYDYEGVLKAFEDTGLRYGTINWAEIEGGYYNVNVGSICVGNFWKADLRPYRPPKGKDKWI
jgi:hypothetical protein